MKDTLIKLITSITYNRLKVNDNGFSVIGVTFEGFDTTPFEKALHGNKLGWTVQLFPAKQASDPNPQGKELPRILRFDNGQPVMLQPTLYIGKSGDDITDVSAKLDEAFA